MKKLILISCLLVAAITINAQQTDFPKLTGPYLGQKPPGDIFSRNCFRVGNDGITRKIGLDIFGVLSA